MAVLMRLEGATFKYSADYYGIPISSLKDQYKAFEAKVKARKDVKQGWAGKYGEEQTTF